MVLHYLFSDFLWSNWLANDSRDFPLAPKRSRTKYSCTRQFWCKCPGDICFFPTEGDEDLEQETIKSPYILHVSSSSIIWLPYLNWCLIECIEDLLFLFLTFYLVNKAVQWKEFCFPIICIRYCAWLFQKHHLGLAIQWTYWFH